jgi:tetratricopeptide (TPR) repeat protein
MRDSGSGGHSAPAFTARSLLLVALAAFVVYFLLPGHPLLEDANMAVYQRAVQEGDLGGLVNLDFWGLPMDADYATRSYRPLVSLSYALQLNAETINGWLAGERRFLHLADMLIHAAMAVLVVLLAAQLLPATRWALPAGFLFAVHPLATEAVCSVVGRADMLASLLLIAALILHLRAGASRRRWLLETGVVLCLGAALYCKEYAVAFPFVLIALDAARLAARRLPAAARRPAFAAWGGALAMLGVYLVVRYALIGALGGVPMIGPGDQPLLEEPLSVRWGTAAALLLTAARLLVAPYALNYFYCSGTLSLADGLFDPWAVGGALFALALIAGAAWLAWRRREILPALAVALFLLPLGPTLNTVSVSGVMFAERFLYLPLAAFVLLGAWILERTLRSRRALVAARVGVVIVCTLAGGMTIARVAEWESSKSLVSSAIDWYPESACAQFRMGLVMMAEDRPEEAAEWFEGSIDTEPRSARAWKKYGDALLKLGRYDEAAKVMRRVVQMSPKDLGPLWAGLGEAELRSGDPEASVRALQRAADLMPDSARTHELLGQARLRLAQQRLGEGHPAEATRLAAEAVDSWDMPAEGVFLAGLIAARAGDRSVADELFADALKKDPDLLRKKHQLAVELDRKGNHERAASLFEEILAARPRHAHTLFNLGRSLVLAGRPARAIPALRAGLELENDPAARHWLSRARDEATTGAGQERAGSSSAQ